MKKIINGKIYNTETATELVYISNNLSSSDFRNLTEYLYVTKKGNFFIYWEWWPMTRYAEKEWNMTYWGKDITAIDKKWVKEWMEENWKNISDEKVDNVMRFLSDELEEA